MESFDQISSVEPTGEPDTISAGGPVPSEIDNLRLQRVLDYQAHALANTNVVESNLASVNSGLLRMALWLEDTIKQAMAITPVTVERMQLVYKAIDTHLRVARQIDRFAQVELRAAAPRQAKPMKTVDVDALAGNTPGPTRNPSEDLSV